MNQRVVIGIGNLYRRDDAAGLSVIGHLRSMAPAGVLLFEHEGEPSGLIELWAGAERAFVVDAVRSGATPGTVHRIEVVDNRLPLRPRRDSSHALGLADALELGWALGRLPDRLTVIGIEAAEFEAGLGLTAAVGTAARQVAEEIRSELTSDEASDVR